MATVQNIIDRAIERSNLNDLALIPTTTLISYVSTSEQNAYLEAARENPDYFGEEGVTATRAYQASWTVSTTPGNVSAVSQAEVDLITGTVAGIAVGDTVELVTIREPEAGIAPRVYLRNRKLHEYGTDLSTDASNFVSRLKIWYSWLPTTRTSVDDVLNLPDEHLGLLIVPLAQFLAVRDQRPDEIPALQAEYNMHLGTFLQAVSVMDEGVIRELDSAAASSRRFQSQQG